MSKIVFFDIDGTLIKQGKKPTQEIIDTIATLQENGIHTAIATGRGPHNIKEIIKELNINTHICFNGQYVTHSNEFISGHYLKPDYLKELSEEVEKNNHEIIYMNEDLINKEQENFETMAAWKKSQIRKITHYSDVYQAIIFAKEGEDHYLDKFQEHYTCVRWSDFAIDVIPIGRSKADGVKKIVEKLNIDIQNVYAFGDGLNDIEMLQVAGTGVAMGNAHEEVKKYADFITTNVDEGGIVYGLQEIGLLPIDISKTP